MLKVALVGIPEAFLVVIPLGVGLAVALDWRWGLGVGLGAAAVTAGRLVNLFFLRALVEEGRGAWKAALLSPARLLLTGAIAIGGISLGLPPLAVVGGLSLPPLVLWARALGWRKGTC